MRRDCRLADCLSRLPGLQAGYLMEDWLCAKQALDHHKLQLQRAAYTANEILAAPFERRFIHQTTKLLFTQ